MQTLFTFTSKYTNPILSFFLLERCNYQYFASFTRFLDCWFVVNYLQFELSIVFFLKRIYSNHFRRVSFELSNPGLFIVITRDRANKRWKLIWSFEANTNTYTRTIILRSILNVLVWYKIFGNSWFWYGSRIPYW